MNLEPLFPNRMTIENCFDHSRGGYTEFGQGHRKFEGLRGPESGGHSKSNYKNIPDGCEKTPSKEHQDCMHFCKRYWRFWCVAFVNENWRHTVININLIWRSNCISALRRRSMVIDFIWICCICKASMCKEN